MILPMIIVHIFSFTSQSDLAIHKKKIEELQTWLQRHLNSKSMVTFLQTVEAKGPFT